MVAPNGPLLSVAEARAARERARSGAQDKGKEVHRWLGERYHQLVESADAVRELASSASRAQGFVARVEDRASAVEAPGAAAAAAPEARPEPADTNDDLAARVVATAPLVWRALDGDDLGAAGGLLARCCVEINQWNGRVQQNFKPLYLGQIEVDSADCWTNRFLSSCSRSTAKELASKLSHTLTLKSG